MAGKTLEDAIQGMINDVQKATISAALLTKDQVKKDFENAAKESVDKYYEYINGSYTRGERQHNLYKIYKVNVGISKGKGNITISSNILMNSDVLEGLYHSNSKRHSGSGSWASGGDVEADYVFKNFIYGHHPWTNGWPRSGEDELEYKLITRRPTPNSFLNSYIDNYGEKYFAKRFEKNLMQLLKAYL